PRAELLLDVRQAAEPGRHLPQVVPLRREAVTGDQGEASVGEGATQTPRQGATGREDLLRLDRRECGVPGALQVVLAQAFPDLAPRVDVAHPLLPEPVSEAFEGDLLGCP